MYDISDYYEKWTDKPVFRCLSGNRHNHLQLIHMKCFAAAIMNSCIMNILVVNNVQLYLSGLLGVCALVVLLSPHLIGKIIPLIFLFLAFNIRFIRGNIILRFGTFYLFCIICCSEIPGFEFLFDLYLIVCYATEGLFSYRATKRLHVMATVICEFAMWMIPCNTMIRLVSTFLYLAVEAHNYPQIWALSTLYVTISGYMFISHLYGVDLDAQLDQVRHSAWFLYEFFIANATLSVAPERKIYRRP